ncbi:MAG: glycosyltransferase family 2 protein [Chryseolinea sp.]
MLYILIPTFNEEQNVPKLAATLKELIDGSNYQIIIVDDCSSDDTLNALRSALPSSNLMFIKKEVNKGPGNSFLLGFEEILKKPVNDNDTVLTFEADNTVSVDDLKLLVKIATLDFQLVLASPYAQGGGFQNTNFLRKVLSFVANLLMRFLFDIKVLTLSSFVRVYRVGLLRKIKAKYPVMIESPGFFSMAEITLKAVKCEARIIEVPVVVQSKERIGKSKMRIIKTSIEYIRMLLKIRL